jgi:ribosome-associated heat shock protein Hsp15
VKVTAILHNRVSAALVPNFLEDITPQAELDKLNIQQDMKTEFRPRGVGRPTKKHRRLIDRLKKGKDFD